MMARRIAIHFAEGPHDPITFSIQRAANRPVTHEDLLFGAGASAATCGPSGPGRVTLGVARGPTSRGDARTRGSTPSTSERFTLAADPCLRQHPADSAPGPGITTQGPALAAASTPEPRSAPTRRWAMPVNASPVVFPPTGAIRAWLQHWRRPRIDRLDPAAFGMRSDRRRWAASLLGQRGAEPGLVAQPLAATATASILGGPTAPASPPFEAISQAWPGRLPRLRCPGDSHGSGSSCSQHRPARDLVPDLSTVGVAASGPPPQAGGFRAVMRRRTVRRTRHAIELARRRRPLERWRTTRPTGPSILQEPRAWRR